MLLVSIAAGTDLKQQTMKILIITLGWRGDVKPYIAL
jgi:hypothetical protein